MLLGKRPRPPMKRTTSMSEIGMDLNIDESKPENSKERQKPAQEAYIRNLAPDGADFRLLAMVSPRNSRRNSEDLGATTHFLQACNLCKRRLGPDRDIFMYRGENAFCSLECRQQQINLDERKEKCSLTSMKKEVPPAKGSETSSNGERVAAA